MRLYEGDFLTGLSSSDLCSASLSPKVFPLLRITGTGFLRIGRKFLKSRELGRVSSRTGVGSGSFEVSLIIPLGKERAGVILSLTGRFEIKSEYGALISNEVRDLFERTTLRHRLMWLDGLFGSKLKV